MEEVLRDACGIFGCATSEETSKHVKISNILYLSLTAIQHRGQESSGMVISNDGKFETVKGMGLVSNVYRDSSLSDKNGSIGIGHNRYSTAGSSSLLNCQPFVVHTLHGQIAVAHNGELVNASKIRKKVLKHGVGLSTESDSELITQLLVHEPPGGDEDGIDWVKRISFLMSLVECSYSIVVMTPNNEIYAFRDVHGNRPLCLGEIPLTYSMDTDRSEKTGTVYVVSSESCAFSSIGARYIREVKPGEIVKITGNGIQSMHIAKRLSDKKASFCIFEYVYFARADSIFEGQLVNTVRKECGRQLALEGGVDADIVSTIPDSANPAAAGFAQQSGIPFDSVVVKNRYVGRTFIQPSPALRRHGVTTKFGPIIDNIIGKRIILIDDSIVRGNTMPHIIELLRNSGAKEIHIRIASPPLKHPCFMGINIPTANELIANKFNQNELAKHFNVDSLMYLSVDGLQKAVSKGIKDSNNDGHCKACLTGNYPVQLEW